ncbi:hypothetical protein IIA29_11470 [candidate division KSB1 bacterium]|nr:hypothetical protein [candidate division KSB1 bacterium]
MQSASLSLLSNTILIVLFTVAGCTNSREVDILSPDKLASSYVELLVCAMDSSRRDTSLQIEDVLLSSGIDSLILQHTLAHYRENPELWLHFISKVNEQLEGKDGQNEQQSIRDKKSTPVSE